MKTLLKLIIFLLLATEAVLASTIILDKQKRTIVVDKNIEFYQPAPNELINPKSLLSADFKEIKLLPAGQEHSSKEFWLKFSVRNPKNTEQLWLFNSLNAVMEVFNLYEVKGNSSLKPIPLSKDRVYFAAIEMAPNSQKTFIIQVQSEILPTSSYKLDYLENITDINSVFGKVETILTFSLGILIAVFIYNALLFISLEDRVYLSYCVLLLITNFFFLISLNFPVGIMNIFGISWIDYSILTRPLTPLTACIFAYDFLNLRAYPKIKVILKSYCFGLLVIMMSYFAGEQAYIFIKSQVMNQYLLLGLILLFSLGIFKWRKGDKTGLFFALSWASVLVGLIVFTVCIYGDNKLVNAWTITAPVTGQVIEMLLISLAVGTRYKNSVKEAQVQIKSKYKQETAEVRSTLRTIVHDIANPLSVITLSNTLLKRKADENLHSYLAKVDRASSVIADLLLLGRNEGKNYGRTSLLSLDSIIEDTLQLFEHRLREKNIVVKESYETKDLTVEAHANPLKTHIFSNVLSNAIKFSDPGSTIAITVRKVDGTLQVKIADEGRGMSPSTLNALRHGGEVQSTRGTEGEKGTGHGFKIASRYIKSIGGSINIDSELGVGTVVRTTFKGSDKTLLPPLSQQVPRSKNAADEL